MFGAAADCEAAATPLRKSMIERDGRIRLERRMSSRERQA
jgi:hypothetical protein